MDAVGRLSYYISQGVYTVVGPFQPFGGAVDIIVVQQEDATFKSTPWYVKFGKFQGVLKRSEKIVSVAVNGVETDFHMYLDKTGEAYFLNEVESDEEETVFSPGSSPSADEARMPSRRESFKDAEAGEDTDGQTETIIDKDGDDEMDANESRVSSNVCYSDRISKVTQNNGETLISFSDHSRLSSDTQIENGYWDSTSKLFSSSAKNDKELLQAPSGPTNSELQMPSNNMVDSSLLPSENGRIEQGSTVVSPLVRELLNVDVVPVVSSHLESSITEKIEGNVVKIEQSADPTEYLGRVLEEGWYSQAETSMYVVEGSPGIHNASGDQISQNDVVLLSGYGAYNYENMNLPQLEPISDTVKLENSNSEVVLMSVDGHVMTAPISSFKDSESTDFFGCQLHLVVDQVDCIQSEERINVIQQALNTATEYGTGDHKLVPEEFVCQQKLQEDTGETDLCDDLVMSRASNSMVEENFADQDDCIQCNERIDLTQQAWHASDEYGTVDHELPPKEFICQEKTQEDIGEIDLCDDLVKRRASNSIAEGNLQSEFNFNNSRCPSDSERQCKQIGQLADEMHGIGFECHREDNAREPDECCLQVKKVNTCEMSRNESVDELEFTFNDEDIFKSCLSLADLSSPMQEEVKQCSLSIPIEEECSVDGSNKNDIKSLDVFQISKFEAFHKEGSHVSDVAVESKLEHSSGSTFNMPRAQTSPLNVPGVHLNGGREFAQAAGSLPNTGVHFPTPEISGANGVFSRSFNIDAVCFKQGSNEDALPPTSQNMELSVSEKDIMQISTAIETSGLPNWNKRETLIASVRPDMDNGIEISLCKHLLSEGMGIDAAAQAFDSEKVSREEFSSLGASIIKNENLIVRIRGRYFAWDTAAPIIMGMVAFGLEAPAEPEGAISVDRVAKLYASDSNVSSGGGWRLWPFPFRRPKTPERSKSAGSALNNEQMVDPEPGLQSPGGQALVVGNDYCRGPQKHMMRTNIPTSEQLASLNLKEGQNIITFTFLTRVLGRQQVDARIYLWKWNTRIVVSDVDGTITKSDVLGQVMPLVGKDWTQTGVARLFSAIKDNGYQLLFLSARAISQAYLTRQFLLNLKQDGKALPDGPVLISPDGLFPSLYREVIRRAPHEFKIACLEDIRSLFPPDCNPFYAGFGNRDTDEISYLKVGIPKGKIFIINPKGEVVVNHSVDVKSYTSLHKLVNDMFPSMSSCEQEDFNSWNYWKVPLPDIED